MSSSKTSSIKQESQVQEDSKLDPTVPQPPLRPIVVMATGVSEKKRKSDKGPRVPRKKASKPEVGFIKDPAAGPTQEAC